MAALSAMSEIKARGERVEGYARCVNTVDIRKMEHEYTGVFTLRLVGRVMLANAVKF